MNLKAFWRGYKLRQSQGPELDKIYKRLNEANANAQEQNTLGSRCKKAVLQLVHVNLGLKEMLRVMEDLGKCFLIHLKILSLPYLSNFLQ